MSTASHAFLCPAPSRPDDASLNACPAIVMNELGVHHDRSDIFAQNYGAAASNDLFIDDLAEVFFLLESGTSQEEILFPVCARTSVQRLAAWRSDDFFFDLCDRESIARYAIDAPQGLQDFFSLIATQLHQLIIQAAHWIQTRPLQGLSLEDRRILIGLSQPFERTELWCTQLSNRLCTLFADGGISITESLRTACGIFLSEQTTALRETAAQRTKTSLLALR